MPVQHFVSVSGGKDSERTAIEAIRRFERRPPSSNLPPRFLACDTGNEEEGWHDFILYLAGALGVSIEIIRADFTDELAMRRANIHDDWGKEKRIRKHTDDCRARRGKMPHAERKALCQCPENVYPPVDAELIERAISLLYPSGNPFLDLCMLKGRFPGMKSRFCTEMLKIEPMMAIKQPLLDAGVNVIEWIGERAQEGAARAAKPMIQRIRHMSGAMQVLYRPIHQLTTEQVFADIAAFGIRWNPLYDDGAKRVGCWPCAFCGKDEVQLIKRRTPDVIDKLREMETLVGMVSRHQSATFFHAPPSKMMHGIDAIVDWSGTSRGGKQFDMFQARHLDNARETECDRSAGVCE